MTWRLILIVGILGVTVAVFMLGWSARAMWDDWRDDRALRAAEARHARRKDDPPRPTVLLADPPPPWHFAGESEQGWAAESAEYELLTQTAALPASSVEGEPPIDTGELLAITDRVEGWIAAWTAQGNVDRHTIQAGE